MCFCWSKRPSWAWPRARVTAAWCIRASITRRSFLKARLCVEGNILTKEFCAAHGVPHNNCGKLVVAAQESEIPELEKIMQNGLVNGVEGMRMVGRERIRQREPHIAAVAALEVPSTGIVAAEELVKTFARVASERGANMLTNARVIRPRAARRCDRRGHRSRRSRRAVEPGA